MKDDVSNIVQDHSTFFSHYNVLVAFSKNSKTLLFQNPQVLNWRGGKWGGGLTEVELNNGHKVVDMVVVI